MPFASKRATRSMCAGGCDAHSRSSGASIVTNCVRSSRASASFSRVCTFASCTASAMPRAANAKADLRESSAQTTSAAAAIGALTSIAPQESPAISATSGSAAGVSSGTLERRERFHVMRVREEVEQVECGEAPTRREKPVRVAGERYRIACEEANSPVRFLRDGIDDAALRADARRIEENEVGARHPPDPPFDRRVHQLHIRRHVPLRVLVRDARALDRRDAVADARDRHAEEADAGVKVDG